MSLLLETGLRDKALEDAALAAAIGERWYGPDLAQGAEMPAVTVSQISGIPELAHQGPSGQTHSRYQFTVWSDCYIEVIQVAAHITRIFSGFRGTLPGGIRTGFISQINRVTLGRDPGQNLRRVALDFRITHQTYDDQNQI